jgi:ectoine hydroxylase-related dioxygenase (phytanoyl-CoA dioxygenase family)
VSVPHLSARTTADDVAAALFEYGCVVVDDVAEAAALDAFWSEIEPFVSATPTGPDDFSGRNTRRTGGLIGRSRAVRDFVTHPLAVDAAKAVMSDGTSIQVHLTQVISIGPGEPAQIVHRDQWAFDFFPFPSGYEVQCNTMWALTDFTEQNGATRVIPGSHRLDDKLRFKEEDTVGAEMSRGSVLFYVGSLYHGGGANRSEAVRRGINITYCRSWVRQEENQYLSVPHDIARTLPDDLLRLMGYSRGAYALGYVDDMRDPLAVLRGEHGAIGFASDATLAAAAGTATTDA